MGIIFDEFDDVFGGFGFDYYDGNIIFDDLVGYDYVEYGVFDLVDGGEVDLGVVDECYLYIVDGFGEW